MKLLIILLFSLFSLSSAAKEAAPFTPEQEKQIEALIHEALFNDPASPRIGAKQAKLTLVNFTDYNCPYCKQLDPLLEKIVMKYPVLRDQMKITQERYQVIGTPTSVLIDPQGRVLEWHQGMRKPAELAATFARLAGR